MSEQSGEFAYLQIERPVVSGLDTFLARARHIGTRILGEVVTTSVSEQHLVFPDVPEGEEAQPEMLYEEIALTQPRMRVFTADDLRVVLFHRHVPREQSSRYSFGYHVNRLEALIRPKPRSVVERITGRPTERTTVYEDLDMVSQQHGQSAEAMPLHFDRVDLIGDDSDGMLLGLYPEPSSPGNLVLQQQAKVAFERMARQSKRLAYPASRWGAIGVPFAAVPTDISRYQYDTLVKELQQQLPIRGLIGEVNVRVKNSRKAATPTPNKMKR